MLGLIFSATAMLYIVTHVLNFTVMIRDAQPQLSPVSAAQIAAWIEQLGHTSFQKRESATAELKKHPSAANAVRAASKSTDPETAHRAKDILRVIDRTGEVQTMARLRAAGVSYDADLFVEWVVRYPGNDNSVWQAVTAFGWSQHETLAKNAGEFQESTTRTLPDRDFATEIRKNRLTLVPSHKSSTTEDHLFIYRGGAFEIGPYSRSRLLVVNGSLAGELIHGITIANGDISILGKQSTALPGSRANFGGFHGVVICDGNIVFPPATKGRDDKIVFSMVVCNGSVTCPASINRSIILATGDITLPEGTRVTDSIIKAGGAIRLPEDYRATRSNLEMRVQKPTAPFQFFDVSRVGIKVTTDQTSGIRVEKIEPKTPFATAGVAVGDVITAIDGKKVESMNGFRRQVRSIYVSGEATLTVRRRDTTKEISIQFTD